MRPAPHPALAALGLAIALLAATAPPLAAREAWHAEADNTWGWPAMTPPERLAHQRRLRGLQRLEDCRAYEAERRAPLRERLRRRGGTPAEPDEPPRDACEELRARGQLR